MTDSPPPTDRLAEKNLPVSFVNKAKNLILQGISEWALPRADQVPLSKFFVSIDKSGVSLRANGRKESQPLTPAALASLKDAKGPQTLDLVFEGESCIDLSFSLPNAVLPELHQIIENEISYRSPFSASASHAFWIAEEQKDGRWRAKVAVFLRNQVDGVLDHLSQAGLTIGVVRRVSREATFAARPSWAGHSSARVPSVARLPAAFLFSFLGAVIFSGSALALLFSTTISHSQLSDDAAAARATLAGQAQSLSGLRRLDEALVLSTQKLAMTGTLSALLPDGVWLDQLIVDQDSVTMIGFAPSAAEITRLLATLPELTDVQFGSPVTRDNSQNLERFRIVATLASAVP